MAYYNKYCDNKCFSLPINLESNLDKKKLDATCTFCYDIK